MRRQTVIKLTKSAYAEIAKKLNRNYFIETPVGTVLDLSDVVVVDKTYAGGSMLWSLDVDADKD